VSIGTPALADHAGIVVRRLAGSGRTLRGPHGGGNAMIREKMFALFNRVKEKLSELGRL
jgi:hypothetical protein